MTKSDKLVKKVTKMQIKLIKSHKLVQKRHQNANLGDKKSPYSEKKVTQSVDLGDKKSLHSEKRSQKCKFMC